MTKTYNKMTETLTKIKMLNKNISVDTKITDGWT